MVKILTAAEAIETFVPSGSVVTIGGFAHGLMHPEELMVALEEAGIQGKIKDLTVIFASGQGDGASRGLNHLGIQGLCNKAIGGHWGLAPQLCKLASENQLAAYNLPQGVISQLFREIAAGRPGVLTHVGLGTFVDPRLEGGKLNSAAHDAGDVVHLINFNGEEKLFYPSFPIDVALIRASYADTMGNCTFEHEGVYAEALAQAQAVRNSGGAVLVQVERVVEYGSLDARLVRIPGIYVDAVVASHAQNHMQTFGTQYDPALSGEIRIPTHTLPTMALDARKVIARRAAMELRSGAVINLGIGVPEGIAAVVAEEHLEHIFLTTEVGAVGGVPANGMDFGAATNVDCILDQATQFDFYDGGGLDVACLGLAQMDGEGNINVSKFGSKITGCGGFINISQNAKKVLFCGTFTTSGLKVCIEDGHLQITREGKTKKLVSQVDQITFSGRYAASCHQTVLYITERAVFELTSDGIELKEIAPGVDLKKDILEQMEFVPIMKNIQKMDSRIFKDVPMVLL